MHDSRRGYPATPYSVVEALPVAVAFVTATQQALPPQALDGTGEAFHRVQVPWYRVVVVVPLHDSTEPPTCLGHGVVHPLPEVDLDLRKLRSHPFRLGLSSHDEPASCPGLRTEVRKAQKIEGLRFAFTPPFPAGGGMAAELDEPGLPGMKLQIESG